MSQKLRSFHFRPALLDSLKHYRRPDFMADLGAGLTVACVALPLAMAFGIASGVKPEQGLITAIIGGALVSLLGVPVVINDPQCTHKTFPTYFDVFAGLAA